MQPETLHKAIFSLILVCSLAIFVRQVYYCIYRYYDEETSINLETLSASQARFPDLTICPDYFVSYKSAILSKYGLSANDVRELHFPKNVSSLAFFDEVTHSLEDIVANIFIQTTSKLRGTNFTGFSLFNEKYEKKAISQIPESFNVMYLPMNSKDWKTQNFILFGKCYTYSLPVWIKALKVLDITFRFQIDALVYLHHVGQFRSPDSDTKASIGIGRNLFLDTKHDITLLWQKKITPTDAHYQNFNITCSEELNEKFDDCLVNAVDSEFMNSIGCTAPFLTNMPSLSCELGAFDDEDRARFRNAYNDFLYERALVQYCPQACASMSITLGYPITSTSKVNEAFMKLYFKSQVTVRKSVITYSGTSMVAEIGGYIGLLLGFSLLDLTKIIKHLFLTTCDHAFTNCKRHCDNKKDKTISLLS